MKQSSRFIAPLLAFYFGNEPQYVLAATDTASAIHRSCPGGTATVPVGLRNLANTCYLNAQLQCAFHVPRVRDLVMNHSPGADDADDPSQASSVALQALRVVFGEMLASAATALAGQQAPVASPAVLCSSLGIPITEQQDSQEFWKLLLPELQSPALTDLYQGAYEDYIVALDGSGRERRREEAFLDLSLDVTSGSVLDSLKAMFGQPELLRAREGNGWRPESGAPQVDAHKGCRLMAPGLPSILQLHLKRFHFDWNTEKTSKLYWPCSFPRTLDLSSLVVPEPGADEDTNVLYELQSVVVHVGEYASGHYYTYVRPDCRSDTWYRVNDERVTQVDFDDVIADAYGGPTLMRPTGDRYSFLARVRQLLTRSRTSYGFGGPTSSAYVLQYILKRRIPILYGDMDPE